MAQRLKHLPAVQESQVRSLGREDPLEEGMATHSSIVWRIPMDRGAWRVIVHAVANSCTITEWLSTPPTHIPWIFRIMCCIIKDWWYFLFIWITLFRTEMKSTFPPKLHLQVYFLLFVLICSSRLHFSFFFSFLSPLFLNKSTLFILSKSLFPLVFSFQLDSAKPD